MSVAAVRQASLYYNRKRRKTLVAVPRLFRTHYLIPGATQLNAFPVEMLDRPVTFETKVDLDSASGDLFSLGTNVVATRVSSTQVDILVRGKTVAQLTTPSTGFWHLVFSIRPGSLETRTWNQYKLVGNVDTDALPGGRFAEVSDLLQADSQLIEPLSIYAAQIPRHFLNGIPAGVIPTSDNFWLNSTALHFMIGFPHPLFED